jgi:hypothetical protein
VQATPRARRALLLAPDDGGGGGLLLVLFAVSQYHPHARTDGSAPCLMRNAATLALCVSEVIYRSRACIDAWILQHSNRGRRMDCWSVAAGFPAVDSKSSLREERGGGGGGAAHIKTAADVQKAGYRWMAMNKKPGEASG